MLGCVEATRCPTHVSTQRSLPTNEDPVSLMTPSRNVTTNVIAAEAGVTVVA